MLRRVSIALQALLFALGVLLLVWLPLSFVNRAAVVTAWPRGGCVVGSSSGIVLFVRSESPLFWGSPNIGRRAYFEEFSWNNDLLWPVIDTEIDYVSIPLWLLAAICLAWPVTSLLLARRRRKGRGFAVEPAADAAPPAIDLPASNLPTP